MDSRTDGDDGEIQAVSSMSITGKSALVAFGISSAVVIFLMIAYTFMAIVVSLIDGKEVRTTEDVELVEIITGYVRFFFILFIFAGSPVFLVSFALLQRFRIKY